MSIPIIPSPLGQIASAAGEGISGFINARNQREWKDIEMAQARVNQHLQLVRAGIAPRESLTTPEFMKELVTARYAPIQSVVPDYDMNIRRLQSDATPEMIRQQLAAGQQGLDTGVHTAESRGDPALLRAATNARAIAEPDIAQTSAQVARVTRAAISNRDPNIQMPGLPRGWTQEQAIASNALGATPQPNFQRNPVSDNLAIMAGEYQLRNFDRFQQETEWSFSDPIARDILAGNIVIETPRNARRALSAAEVREGVTQAPMTPRMYRVDPRTKQRTLLGLVSPEQAAGLRNRTVTSDDRRLSILQTRYNNELARTKTATYAAYSHNDPRKTEIDNNIERIGRTLEAQYARAGVTGAGTGEPQAAVAPAPAAVAPAATPPPPTPRQRVAAWITSYGVTTDILNTALDDPAILNALASGDTQHARAAALAKAQTGNRDPAQSRQIVVAINHFFNYLEADTGNR